MNMGISDTTRNCDNIHICQQWCETCKMSPFDCEGMPGDIACQYWTDGDGAEKEDK
jgi:hypothetical protein